MMSLDLARQAKENSARNNISSNLGHRMSRWSSRKFNTKVDAQEKYDLCVVGEGLPYHRQVERKKVVGPFLRKSSFSNFGLKWPFTACPALGAAVRTAQFNLPRTSSTRGIDCCKNLSSQSPTSYRKMHFYAIFGVF